MTGPVRECPICATEVRLKDHGLDWYFVHRCGYILVFQRGDDRKLELVVAPKDADQD